MYSYTKYTCIHKQGIHVFMYKVYMYS